MWILLTNEMHPQLAQIKRQNLHLPDYRSDIDAARVDFPFSWFVTLDFRNEPDRGQGIAMAMGWVIYIARKYGAHLKPFLTSEPDFTGKRFSIHMILLSDQHIKVSSLRQAWKKGFGVIRIYRPNMGASEYMYKAHLENLNSVVCSGKKPCRVNRQGKIFCSFKSKSESI